MDFVSILGVVESGLNSVGLLVVLPISGQSNLVSNDPDTKSRGILPWEQLS